MKHYFLLLLCLLTANAYAQLASHDSKIVMEELSTAKVDRLKYDLYVGKGQIGQFKVSKTVKGDLVRYQAESNATINFLGENTISYTLDCWLKNEVLQYSHVKVYKNGKLKDDTLIKWNGARYEINKNGKLSSRTTPIHTPAIALYFEEPSSKQVTVFSEREAQPKSFKRQTNNQYKLTDVGKRSGDDYTYVNGSLEDVTVNYVITNFRAVKRN